MNAMLPALAPANGGQVASPQHIARLLADAGVVPAERFQAMLAAA